MISPMMQLDLIDVIYNTLASNFCFHCSHEVLRD